MTATRQAATLEWTVGDRLRKARHYAEMEQGQLAAEIGVSRATIINWENGHTKPHPVLLRACADACGVSVDWLKTGLGPKGGDGNQEPAGYCRPFRVVAA